MTTISRTNSNDSVWVAQCICDRYDVYGNVIHCCPEELREQRDKEDQERVDKMKETYGPDMWIWFVEGTVNDCELAAVHRRWLYKKGFPEDFDIHDDAQREFYYGKYEGRNQEEEDGYQEDQEEQEEQEEEQEKENAYVYQMYQKYGGQWCWTVENTKDDSSIAEKYRRWVDDKCQKSP